MGTCSKCGEKLGFFNKQTSCVVCNNAACNKCLTWNVIMGADRKYAWQDEIQSEYHVCSAGCAIGLYNRFMKNVTQGIPLVLVNESNIGLGVREDLKKGAKEISIAYMRIDPSQAPSEGEGFNKQMAPVYSRIKKDLARRKIKFKEEFENVV